MLVTSTNDTQWREIPDPSQSANMKARVIVENLNINCIPVEKDSIVDVDPNTFRNLVKDGFLEPIDEQEAEPDEPTNSAPAKKKKGK